MADPASSPADDVPEVIRTPSSARFAIMLLWIMAGLLLASAALTVVQLDSLADRATRVSDIARADAQSSILVAQIPLVLLGLILGLSAWGLSRRHAWARWTALGATVMLFGLTLLTILAGGVGLIALLLLLMAMAASTSLLTRATAEWIPRLRGGH